MKLVYVIGALFVMLSCSKEQDRVLPIERDLVESVYSSVTIQPDSLYQAFAIVAGIVDHHLVAEGDTVAKGEALIQIINNTPKLNAKNAKLTWDLATENLNGSSAILKSIADEIMAAELKYQNDSINYFRQKNLWDRNIGSKVQFDTQKLNFELSENNLKMLRSKFSRTKNELETAVKQAKNRYQSSLITTQDFTIKSTMNGTVYALYKEPGEIVTTMEPLASIGSTTRFNVEMLVDEVDIVKIAEHQDVLITLDAYQSKVFKGRVSKIYPKKDERNQTFKVEAVFLSAPKVLYPGLSGEANIIIAKKDKVLTIPKAFLINDNHVQTDDGVTTITTGLQNMEYVEVLSGLTKDTYIYKPE